MFNLTNGDLYFDKESQNDYEYYKQIIQSKIDEKNKMYEELDRIWIEENTPQKGVVKKEIWDVPLPTNFKIMKSDVDYNFLSVFMLKTNYGGKVNNMCERFIYKNKLWKVDDENNIPIIADELSISERTMKRKLDALLRTDLGLLEICKNADNEVFYKIKYAKDDKYYITIKNDMLEMLITCTNSNMIKLYSLMCYNLRKAVPIGNGLYTYKYIRKQLTYDYLAENIGLKKGTNRKRFKAMIDTLALLGFIKIYEIDTPKRTIDKTTNKERVLTVKGYEYELCTYEEWKETVAKAINK